MRTLGIFDTFFFKKIARIDRMISDAVEVNKKRKELIEHIIANDMAHYLNVAVGANKNSIEFCKELNNSAVCIHRITRKMKRTAELIDSLKTNCKLAIESLAQSSFNYDKQTRGKNSKSVFTELIMNGLMNGGELVNTYND